METDHPSAPTLSGARLIRIAEVCERTTLTQSTIYKMMREGTFPEARRIGKQAVAWIEAEIDEWIRSQPVHNREDWHTPLRRRATPALKPVP